MEWTALQVAASTEAVAVAQNSPSMVCWGGLGQVVETMAAQLTDVRLSTAVTTVHHTASGVSVHTSTGILPHIQFHMATGLSCRSNMHMTVIRETVEEYTSGLLLHSVGFNSFIAAFMKGFPLMHVSQVRKRT